MTTTTYRGRTFDYVPRLDERNNRYLVRDHLAATSTADWDTSTWWTPGPVLDQGREGACCGFAAAGEAAASPVRQPRVTDATALQLYRRAKEIDEYEGVDYDGTSVRAALLVGREYGWWGSFYWSKNMDELRVGLDFGPVDIGVRWKSSMYDTDAEGVVDTSGFEVGWHSILITGYSPRYGRARKPRFRWRNSWGPSYGRNGSGYIAPDALEAELFDAGGEAGVVLDRRLAPTPEA